VFGDVGLPQSTKTNRMKSKIPLLIALLVGNGCAGTDEATNRPSGPQPGQTPQQVLTSTNAGRVVVLTLEEAKRIVGERRTIEMPIPTACRIAGGEVLLQNAWGMIPTLASSFGFGSIGVQKDRLTSIPNPVILVLTCNDKRYIV